MCSVVDLQCCCACIVVDMNLLEVQWASNCHPDASDAVAVWIGCAPAVPGKSSGKEDIELLHYYPSYSFSIP